MRVTAGAIPIDPDPPPSRARNVLYSPATLSVDHYENFPVASVLCPPHIRPAVVAIYHFARTADDLADEGDASTEQRIADLAQYRADLVATLQDRPPSERWAAVFGRLQASVHNFALPGELLHALLDAFEQDVHNPFYADRTALLDYCRLSANPIGRLLLHLYGIHDAASLQRADAICSALQLINFWQDLSVDGPRGRHYVPTSDLHRHGLSLQAVQTCQDGPAARALVADLCRWAHELMQQGTALPLQVQGRAGWELRLVLQGGLRILEKIRRMDHATLTRRPSLSAADMPLLLWRAWRMAEARV